MSENNEGSAGTRGGIFDEEERPPRIGIGWPDEGRPWRAGKDLMREERKLLTFRWDLGRNAWFGEVFCAFRPRGLVIWGAPPGSTVDVMIRNQMQITATHEPAPCEFFSMGKTFEQIEKMVKDGLEPPSWTDFQTIEITDMCRLRIMLNNESLGPSANVRLCMWGIASVRL